MFERAETPHSELKIFKCKNRLCRRVVGASDGESIYLLGKKVPFNPHFISFDCPNCGETVQWRKSKTKK